MSARAMLVGKICTEIEEVGNIEKSGAKFSLVCRDGKNSVFIKCVSWGKMADTILKYLSKGDIVEIQGRIKLNEYINTENIKYRNTYVLVDNVEFIVTKEKYENEQFDFSKGESNE